MKVKDTKGQAFGIQQLASVAIVIVVIAMVSVLGMQLLGDQKDDIGVDDCAARSDGFTSYNSTADQCYNSSGSHVAVGTAQFNATTDGITGIGKIPDKLPLIVGAIVLVIVISIIILAFRTINN